MFDPLTLILFIIFIVLPLVNNLVNRGQQPRGGNRQAPRRQGQAPPGRRQDRGRSAGQTGRATKEQPSPSGDSSFTKRLEEARRRVQEALEQDSAQSRPSEAPMGSETKGRSLGEPGTLFEAPPSTPSQRPQPQSSQMAGRSQTSFLPSESLTARGSFDGLTEALETASALQVERRKRKNRTAIPGQGAVKLDDGTILQGFIWHQILSEPVSKRRSGRKPSPRP